MAYNDPNTANADKCVNNLSERLLWDFAVDHKSKERACNQRNDSCDDHWKISHIQSTKDQTDGQNNKIIHTEETNFQSKLEVSLENE